MVFCQEKLHMRNIAINYSSRCKVCVVRDKVFVPMAFIDGQYIRTGTARGNCLSLQPNVSLWQNELVQQPCNGKDKLQRFAFMHIAGGTFRISPSWKRDVCLAAGDIEWGGARLVLQPCSGGVSISQEFFFHPLTGRWWMIGGRYRPGDCLNVVDGSPDAGKLVRLYSCSGNSAQRFILPKFKPVTLPINCHTCRASYRPVRMQGGPALFPASRKPTPDLLNFLINVTSYCLKDWVFSIKCIGCSLSVTWC
ncbi:hypothetical protein VOLCADRAFT_91557 [Volvox carteri f. nagariensis]|uniref:Ricin B lectin domain-containing protein n=1 Tax=Volvox carteri f. nagariensis TaxID=3068 RepID=D8TXD9_VOLCA|nr:uncharacterized protein VOLCADRAFT_91557 [Volvox carteri f. nagariensis]EFJ47892.1 hypothetical protein VOLCADRAFT_91557 [Volvox carteri f. nagariensis]|eukprot:XP_002950998.1 hypothetical protein VOLCADRAFT_91557 [Volvox carteri f. nagariensis]